MLTSNSYFSLDKNPTNGQLALKINRWCNRISKPHYTDDLELAYLTVSNDNIRLAINEASALLRRLTRIRLPKRFIERGQHMLMNAAAAWN